MHTPALSGKQRRGFTHSEGGPAEPPPGVSTLRALLERLLAEERRKRGAHLGALARRSGTGGDNISEPIPPGRAIPVINRLAAGYPADFTDLDYPPSIADEYVHGPNVDDPQAFAARVVGDSMEPKYRQGDLVIFAPNAPARSGDDCFVRFARDNSTTFKRVSFTDSGRIRLEPLNGNYQAEEYDREEITGLWPAVLRAENVRRP